MLEVHRQDKYLASRECQTGSTATVCWTRSSRNDLYLFAVTQSVGLSNDISKAPEHI